MEKIIQFCKQYKKEVIILTVILFFVAITLVTASSLSVFSDTDTTNSTMSITHKLYSSCYATKQATSPGSNYVKRPSTESLSAVKQSDTKPTGDMYANVKEKTLYSTRTETPKYGNWSAITETKCTGATDVCTSKTGYRVKTRSSKGKETYVTAQCPNGTVVAAANRVTGSCKAMGCTGGTYIAGGCHTTYSSQSACWASCTSCQYSAGTYYCSSSAGSYTCTGGYNYSYNCNGIAYYNPTYGNNCAVGVSGTNCVVTEGYTSTATRCPSGYPNEISGTCYQNWPSNYSLATSCTGSNTTQCTQTTVYQTRTKTIEYGQWSSYGTTACTTSNTNTCRTKTVYEYQEKLYEWCIKN